MINDLGYRVSRYWRGVSKLGLIGSALCSTAAWAVGDLPGGPAVRQLDLPPSATKIAAAQTDLHYMMLYSMRPAKAS